MIDDALDLADHVEFWDDHDLRVPSTLRALCVRVRELEHALAYLSHAGC